MRARGGWWLASATMAVGALTAAIAISPAAAHAAEIKVMAANVFKGVLVPLVPGFEATTGHRVA